MGPLALALLAAPSPTWAAPGDLVSSFGTSGLATTAFDRAPSSYCCAEVQADGKILAAGSNYLNGGEGSFLIARYGTDGTLDGSFGVGGMQTTTFGRVAVATGMLLQTDGKVLVTGDTYSDRIALARYTSAGTLDPSFSDDGKTTVDVDCVSSEAAALQADGKIVVACSDWSTPGKLVRLNADGSLDETFGTSGVLEVGNGFRPRGLAVQAADGKLVVAGPSALNSAVTVRRYSASGTLDGSFDGDGERTVDLGSGSQADVSAVRLQADGKIVIAGQTEYGSSALVRIGPDGTPDVTFSGDGVETGTFQGALSDVALLAGGSMLAVGRSSGDVAVARFTDAGSLDGTFSGDGKATTDMGGIATGYDVALQADGAAVVAVGDASPFGATDTDARMLRYSGTGTLDSSFGDNGQLTTAFPGADSIEDVVVEPGGKITAAGLLGRGQVGVARYLNDGEADTSFSSDGRTTTGFSDLDSVVGGWLTGVRVARQPDGKTIVAAHGSSFFGGGTIFVARYSVEGVLDPSFSGDGKMSFGANAAILGGIVVLGNGDILIGGGLPDYTLWRLTPEGALDTSFSGDGTVTVDLAGSAESIGALAVDKDGKLIAAGASEGGGSSSFDVFRFNDDGTLDTAFSGDGRDRLARDAGGRPYAVLVQPDGKIAVAGGDAYYGGIVVARWLDDGTFERSFTDVPISGAYAADIVREPSGELVVAGTPSVSGGLADFVVVRYTAAGEVDSSFSGDGVATTDVAGSEDAARTIALRPDGDILAAGLATSPFSVDFALAVYEGTRAPAAVPPSGGRPTVTGSPSVGSTLSCAPGTWSGDQPMTTTYQWLRSGSVVGTGSTHVVTDADQGHGLRCRVTVANAAGEASASSDEVAVAAAVVEPPAQPQPQPQPPSDVAPPVSSPPPPAAKCVVPALKGARLRAARAALKRANCRLGQVRRKRAPRRKKGVVLSQSRRPGSTHARDTAVSIVLGKLRPRA